MFSHVHGVTYYVYQSAVVTLSDVSCDVSGELSFTEYAQLLAGEDDDPELDGDLGLDDCDGQRPDTDTASTAGQAAVQINTEYLPPPQQMTG